MNRPLAILLTIACAACGEEAFTFTVTADPPLDERTDRALYRQTLLAAAAARTAFHIDLGDTFMTEKLRSREEAAPCYEEQRRFFDLLGAPVCLVSGNHDGEGGGALEPSADGLAAWSRSMRLRYFPNPLAAGPANLYAWRRGDALFVALDPYWFSPPQRRPSGNWRRTLGAEQCRWLTRTLETNTAAFTFTFVFIHQLVGGADRQGRGGVEVAPFYEWGGKNADGANGFAVNRPGWPLPIHRLLASIASRSFSTGTTTFTPGRASTGSATSLFPSPAVRGRGA